MGKIYLENIDGIVEIPNKVILASFIVSMAFIIAVYLLRSIGVYTLSKKAEVKNAWLAFIPLLWYYPLCMLIKENKFFNKTIGKYAIIITLIFTIAGLLNLAYNFLNYFPLVGYYLSGGEVYFNFSANYLSSSQSIISVGENFNNPYVNRQLVENIMTILYYVSDAFNLAVIFLDVTVYFALFRKYWPQHYFVGAVLSVFNLFPFFVFAIRKHEPVDYKEFLRKRYGAYYGNPYGPYGNPNDPNNPYNRNNHNSDPFNNEFNNNSSEKNSNDNNNNEPDDPFEEFNTKK